VSVRSDLLEAIAAGDHQAAHRLGWGEVWEDLARNWAPRQGCTLAELGAYVRLLGDEKPEEVVAAIRECAGEFRPVPGAVLAALKQLRGETRRVDVGRGRHRSAGDDALQAVADALAAGEHACPCGCPTSLRWSIDSRGVLRCPAGHLEPGQVYSAEDAGLIAMETA
jgi:hypothetical protein